MAWIRLSGGKQKHFCESSVPGPLGLTYMIPVCGAKRGLRETSASYSGKQFQIPICKKCEIAVASRANQGGAAT